MFKALGVNFELEGVPRGGVLTVRNTESRVADLCQCLHDIKGAETFKPMAAEQLAGRMRFAASRVFGRTGSART